MKRRCLSILLLLAVLLALQALVLPVLAETDEEIVAAAYALQPGESLEGTKTLTGVITNINTAYSESDDRITVTIMESTTGYGFQCYRMTGGAELRIGNTISVTGTLTNYKGTVEFAAGAAYALVSAETADFYVPESADEIWEAARKGLSYGRDFTVTGLITSIDTEYDAGYDNVTLTMALLDGPEAGTRTISCFRLAGGETLVPGDLITVTGHISLKNGNVQFDAGAAYREEKYLVILENGSILAPSSVSGGDYSFDGQSELSLASDFYFVLTERDITLTAVGVLLRLGLFGAGPDQADLYIQQSILSAGVIHCEGQLTIVDSRVAAGSLYVGRTLCLAGATPEYPCLEVGDFDAPDTGEACLYAGDLALDDDWLIAADEEGNPLTPADMQDPEDQQRTGLSFRREGEEQGYASYVSFEIARHPVSFDMDGHGEQVPEARVPHGGYCEKPSDPSANGFTFHGWFADPDRSVPFDFTGTPITEDTVVYALWSENSYNVTWVVDGVSTVEPGYRYGDTPVWPGEEDPAKTVEGWIYTFTGWDPELQDITEDVIYTAKFRGERIVLTVSFDLQGHGDPIDDQPVYYGERIPEPQDPADNGYTFRGWYLDEDFTDPWDFGRTITEGTVLHALWTENTYTVTWIVGDDATLEFGYRYGDAPVYPEETDPVRESTPYASYIFKGWSPALTEVTVDATYTAVFEEIPVTFPVTFDLHGHGGTVPGQSVAYGAKVILPEDPEDRDFSFAGWYLDADGRTPYDFGAPVTGELVLHALWTPKTGAGNAALLTAVLLLSAAGLGITAAAASRKGQRR